MRVVEVNIDATAHLLDMARRHGLRRFVFLSSHVVYGDVGPGRIDEQSPLHPGSTYAASKVAGEALVESFSREFGLSAASLRLTRVYGPYRRDDCFMRAMVLDAAAGRTTTIPCDPDFRYHYVHVDDVARATIAALLGDQPRHGTYNVTSGEALTMPAIVEIARQALPGARIEMVPGVDGAPEVQQDFALERAASELGWRPRLSLLQGLADYAAHMPESGRID